MRSARHAGAAAAIAAFMIAGSAGLARCQAQAPPPQLPPPIVPPGQTGSQQPPPWQSFQSQSRRGYVPPPPRKPIGPTVKLPPPKAKGTVSVEEALWGRRTLLSAAAGQLTLEEAGELLWAAQGVTGEWGRRAAPSAGGAYALDALLVAGDVAGLTPGVYRYYGALGEIEHLATGDKRPELAQVTKFDGVVRAPAVFVITAVEARAMQVFPSEQTVRHHVAVEAGAAAQNLMLEAVALGLGSAQVSDSDEATLARSLGLAPGERPYVIVVVARR